MNSHQTPLKQKGMTLIEVLVTLVILSIGILGLAGLQIVGLRTTTNAAFTSQATNFANDIVEVMRTNEVALDAGLFSGVDSASTINCAALPAPFCSDYHNGASVAATSCTPAQLATFDINVWYCGVPTSGGRVGGIANILPSPSATITCTDSDASDANPCSINSSRTVTINWTEINPDRYEGAAATLNRSITVSMMP